MPNIRPSSELRNNYNEISAFCHKYGEPVYITKNGTGDLAVLSIEDYERLVGKYELRTLLDKGLADVREGRTVEADNALASVREALKHGAL